MPLNALPSSAIRAALLTCVVVAGLGNAVGHAADAPAAGLKLAQDKSCMRCHAVERHYVGPSFAQVADRYRGDSGAAERLTQRIRQGSVGAWGRVIMPRQPHVTEADAAVLADWIVSQGQQPAR